MTLLNNCRTAVNHLIKTVLDILLLTCEFNHSFFFFLRMKMTSTCMRDVLRMCTWSGMTNAFWIFSHSVTLPWLLPHPPLDKKPEQKTVPINPYLSPMSKWPLFLCVARSKCQERVAFFALEGRRSPRSWSLAITNVPTHADNLRTFLFWSGMDAIHPDSIRTFEWKIFYFWDGVVSKTNNCRLVAIHPAILLGGSCAWSRCIVVTSSLYCLINMFSGIYQ